ncbi:MAG: PAS domain S-box protein [Candidatus Omnitrophota bacterium]
MSEDRRPVDPEEAKAKASGRPPAAVEPQHSDINYQKALSAAFDGFWINDRDGRFLDVNEAYLKLTGYSREEFLKLNLKDIDVPEDPEGIAQHIQDIMRTGKGRFETRHRGSDGSLIHVEVSVHFSGLEGGRFYTFVRDITESWQAEEALKRSY